MEWYFSLSAVAISILFLLALRMPLGFVFGVVGVGGILLQGSSRVCLAIAQQMHDMLTDFVLITIPLFVLMAELLYSAGFIPELFGSFQKLAGRLRGSLSMVTIVASALFSAVCGSSYVATASLSRMAMPEMLRRGYHKPLAAGSVAAGGSLGILIPPSLAFVIYGYMSGTSIAALFIAGILPGFLLATLFFVSIAVLVKIAPSRGGGLGDAVAWKERIWNLYKILPVALLASVLLASIYLGIATPAEAAALGSIFSLILCFFYGKLSKKMLISAFKRTISMSGFLLLLMSTAKILSFMMAKSGMLYGLQDILSELPVWSFVLILFLTISILGLFLEGTSIIVLTTPILIPAVKSLGIDMLWYGVILVLFIEIALLTPPVGMNCYIVAEVSKDLNVKVEDVFKGISPFLIALIITVIIVTFFPQVVSWLPSTMK